MRARRPRPSLPGGGAPRGLPRRAHAHLQRRGAAPSADVFPGARGSGAWGLGPVRRGRRCGGPEGPAGALDVGLALRLLGGGGDGPAWWGHGLEAALGDQVPARGAPGSRPGRGLWGRRVRLSSSRGRDCPLLREGLRASALCKVLWRPPYSVVMGGPVLLTDFHPGGNVFLVGL